MKLILTLGLSLAITCTAIASDTSALKTALTSVPAPELPAKAATLVKDAKARERQVTASFVVKEAVKKNPAAAPAIVGAVAKAVPDMAAHAAATAATEQPGQAAAIAKAAAAAAPSKAGKIVAAVCRATPNSYREVAVAVAKAVPGSAKQILASVASALPQLKDGIEKALASHTGNISVAAVLDSAASNPGPGAIARGPAVGPPYIPASGTPVNTSPENSTDVPPHGRNYAAP
jgi:hypothetical protein